MSGGHLCKAEAPTEPAGETHQPLLVRNGFFRSVLSAPSLRELSAKQTEGVRVSKRNAAMRFLQNSILCKRVITKKPTSKTRSVQTDSANAR